MGSGPGFSLCWSRSFPPGPHEAGNGGFFFMHRRRKSHAEARLACEKCAVLSLHAYLRCFGPFCTFRRATRELMRIYATLATWGSIHAFLPCDLAGQNSCVFLAFWQKHAFLEGRSLGFSALLGIFERSRGRIWCVFARLSPFLRVLGTCQKSSLDRQDYDFACAFTWF